MDDQKARDMTDPTDDSVLTALREFIERELAMQRERLQTRAERFRAAATETHATWRDGLEGVKYDCWRERAVFMEGVKDIIRMRLRIAYMPLFQGLERIERRCGILADLRREPWAAATHPVNEMAT